MVLKISKNGWHKEKWKQKPESEKIVGPIFLTIDKTNVPPVTKFTYLRELLDVRVRRTVETLPHSAEGYNRAVAIVTDRFGKQSETVKPCVKEIFELPETRNNFKMEDSHLFRKRDRVFQA